MQRKSEIGHTGLPFNCPHTDDIASEIISLMNLSPDSQVLDLGCGKAELLTRIVERYECRGTGVDSNPAILNKCRQPARGSLELRELDMTEFLHTNETEFDAILCVGSIREGQQEQTIKQLVSMLSTSERSGSSQYILIGELVWINQPSEEFLQYLHMEENNYCSMDRLSELFEENGLEVVFSTSQSLENYETCIHANIESWASDPKNIADVDYDIVVGKSREWHDFSKTHAWNTWEFATILGKLVR